MADAHSHMIPAPDLGVFFEPKSIAVIGASPDRKKIRGRLLAAVMNNGFEGAVYPVNPSHAEVQGLKAYARITELPTGVDLALIAIAAEVVPDALEDCARQGIKNAIIYSSGFGEVGPEKKALEERIKQITRTHDIRVCGPNSVGYHNAAKRTSPTFSPGIDVEDAPTPVAGHKVAIVSQSGGLAFSMYGRGVRRGIGFSIVISTGNEVDLGALDFVEHMLADEQTGAVILYLERLRHTERLEAVAARAAELGKPLIVAKVGRSPAATEAALSHTGAMTGSDEAYEAVFRHNGILRADDQDELLDIAAAAVTCPPFRGRRIGIVSITGGGGVWLADACADRRLEVPPLDAERQKDLRKFVPDFGGIGNPVDITAQALELGGRCEAIDLLYDAPEIDAIAVVETLAERTMLLRDRDKLAAIAARREKPLVFATYTLPADENTSLLSDIGLHCFSSFQGCARGLAALADFAEHRGLSACDQVPATDVPRLPAEARVYTEQAALPVLAALGLSSPSAILAASADEAANAAREIGYPVVLKAQSPKLLHKSDAGGVALDLADEEAVRTAYPSVAAAASTALEGVLVQKMMPRGLELIVGITRDDDFGPMLMVGLGGVLAETLRDTVLSPVPFGPARASALLENFRGAALLEGVRGGPALDKAALIDLLVKLSVFADRNRDCIREVDLNPVVLYENGLTVLDALIVTGELEQRENS